MGHCFDVFHAWAGPDPAHGSLALVVAWVCFDHLCAALRESFGVHRAAPCDPLRAVCFVAQGGWNASSQEVGTSWSPAGDLLGVGTGAKSFCSPTMTTQSLDRAIAGSPPMDQTHASGAAR